MTEKETPCWTAIVNQTLSNSDFAKILIQNNIRVRVSASTINNSIILPASGVAFYILSLHSVKRFGNERNNYLEKELLTQLEKFIKTHAHCYVLALAPLHGQQEQKIYSDIQMRFLDTKLNMIPIHNVSEGVKAIVGIGKLLCKPTHDLMFKRLNKIAQEKSSCDIVTPILNQIGLSDHHIQVIQDGLGSLSRLASAEKEDLLDCSLDKDTVTKILQFFSRISNKDGQLQNKTRLKS